MVRRLRRRHKFKIIRLKTIKNRGPYRWNPAQKNNSYSNAGMENKTRFRRAISGGGLRQNGVNEIAFNREAWFNKFIPGQKREKSIVNLRWLWKLFE